MMTTLRRRPSGLAAAGFGSRMMGRARGGSATSTAAAGMGSGALSWL